MSSKKREYRKLTDTEWAEIRTEYIQSDCTLTSLAEQYKDRTSKYAIVSRSTREKWRKARTLFQASAADEKERQSVDLATDGITVEEQAECRRAYRGDARTIMDKVRTIIAESQDLSSIDLQRIATTARTCQQIEFAALRIPIDAIDVSGRVEGAPMTWLDMMLAERDKKGLPKGGP